MKHGEKIAVVVAGVLFLSIVIWTFFPESAEMGDSASIDASDRFSMESIPVNETFSRVVWGQPSPQGGPNWIFDIFTPPVIYYDEETGTFTVTPPFPGAKAVNGVFELELLQVQPQPYRFQLVSYAGAKGNYVLTLEDLETGKDVFTSPNEMLSDHGLEVVSFIENRVVASSARAGTTEAFDLVGEAIVRDQNSGQQYTLRHNQITYLENPRAIFKTNSGATLQLDEGGVWSSETATYTIQSIHSEAQSASVEKSSTDVGDKVIKLLQASESFNTTDLSTRNTRPSEPPPGAF